MPQSPDPQHGSQITGGQGVPAALGLKERAQSPSQVTGAPQPGGGQPAGVGHWLSAHLGCATQSIGLAFGLVAKTDTCGLSLPCSTV